jgi:hypothetical protein
LTVSNVTPRFAAPKLEDADYRHGHCEFSVWRARRYCAIRALRPATYAED